MTIAVFGSINMDLVARAPRLPSAGETVAGYGFSTALGGKGANQAVACARLGCPTRLVGRVGSDDFGTRLVESLFSAGVESTYIATDPSQPSGVALIALDDRGENTIIVVPGANSMVGAADLARLEQALDGANMLLLQLEVPLSPLITAAEMAHQRGIVVMLDPAPAKSLPPALYMLADVLTPNESEAAVLVGFSLDTNADIELAASMLLDRGARAVVIKLGGRGAYAGISEGGRFWPPFLVEAIDTVGAGDAFNGGMAVALAEGLPFDTAVRWGLAAGAFSVTRPGTQSAMPTRAELLAMLAR